MYTKRNGEKMLGVTRRVKNEKGDKGHPKVEDIVKTIKNKKWT